jgi:hypothetical protein
MGMIYKRCDIYLDQILLCRPAHPGEHRHNETDAGSARAEGKGRA